jgi:hypothetical protein
MVDYLKEMLNSWKLYKNNLIILVIFLFSSFAFILFLGIAALEFLLIFLIGTGGSFTFANFTFSPLVITLITLFLIINYLLSTLLNSFFQSMLLVMYDQICRKGKTSLNNLIVAGKKYLYINFKIKVLRLFFIYLLPLIVLFILPLLFLISKQYVISIILAILFGGIYFIYLIFVMFGLLFLHPIITTTKSKSAIAILKQSFNYLFNMHISIFATWGLGTLLSIAVMIVMFPLVIMERLMATIFPPIVALTIPIRTIIQVFLVYYIGLFKFKIYYTENKIK